jgi:hypothetical protein
LADHVLVVANGADAAFLTGNLQWIQDEVSAARSLNLPEDLIRIASASDALLHIGRGHWDEAAELITSYHRGDASLDERGASLAFMSRLALGCGDLERTYELALKAEREMAQNGMFARTAGAHAAVWLRDIERLNSAIAALEETDQGGPIVEAGLVGFRAVLACHKGRVEEGLMEHARAMALLRDHDVRYELGLHQIGLFRTLGSDHPRAEQAADEVRRVFTEMRAEPYLARLEDRTGASRSTAETNSSRDEAASR